MGFFGIRLAVLASMLLAGASADAATLVTGALRIRPTGDFSCLISNDSTREVRVAIRMIRMDGALTAAADPILGPSETYHFKDQSPAGEATRCRFEFSGNPKYFRALACVGTETSGCTAVAPAQ